MEQQVLRSMLISLQGGQAVLPSSSLVEVLPFAAPLKLENAPLWVVGTVLWRSLNIPLVSLEWLIYDTGPGRGVYSRIVVVYTLSKDPKLPCFGFLTTSAPHLLNVERAHIGLDEAAGALKPGVLSWVKVNDQRACIPDMGAIEAQLIPLMYRA
jgi:chemosensory pili system protein ChpC